MLLGKATERSPHQTKILDDIEKLVTKTPNPLLLFDIDDTLFSTVTREIRIWREYGEKYDVPKLRNFPERPIKSWDLKEVMVDQLGLDLDWFQDHRDALRFFWKERFFSNEYVQYDTPLPGASDYLRALHQGGGHIFYITGRNREEMEKGTKAILKKYGFPFEVDRATLFMNDFSNQALIQKNQTEEERKRAQIESDRIFKEKTFAKVKKMGTAVASFDNESKNINRYYEVFHQNGFGYAVLVKTLESIAVPLQKGVVTIQGFLR